MHKEPANEQFCLWSQQLSSASLFGLYAASTLYTGMSLAAPVANLDNWRFSPKDLKLEIRLSANTTPQYFYLAQPPRLVVDLPDTKLGRVSTQQNYAGAIQRIRVSQLNATVTRIVMDLAPGSFVDPKQVQLQPISQKNTTRWVLRPVIRRDSPAIAQPSNNPTPSSPNYQSAPVNPPLTQYQTPQLPSTLPLTTTNPQQPFVSVPPLNPSNSSGSPGYILPPPSFPNQPSNINNNLPVISPNFPAPTIPESPPNDSSFIEVIEFGQPLPRRK